MTLDLKVVLRAGIIWGIVGALLLVAATLLPLPVEVDGLSLGTFAMMFAGVHFSAKGGGNLIVALIGGAVSAAVAGLILMIVNMVLPGAGGSMGDAVTILGSALVAGIAGAAGMRVVNKF